VWLGSNFWNTSQHYYYACYNLTAGASALLRKIIMWVLFYNYLIRLYVIFLDMLSCYETIFNFRLDGNYKLQ
jgi:hypothetical protein